MSVIIRMIIRSRIISVCLICLALIYTTRAAKALEGFKFVAQRSTPCQVPTYLTSLGKQPGFVMYDCQSNNLVFLNSELAETNRINLTQVPGYIPKDIIGLQFDQTRNSILVFDAGRSFFSAAKSILLSFSPDGKLEKTMNLMLKAPDRLSSPTCLAIDTTGILYIGDKGENDIKAFIMDGTHLFSIHLPLDVNGKKPRFSVSSMTVLADGTLAAVDSKSRNIVFFSREGRFIIERPLEGDYKIVKKLMALDSGELLGIDSAQKIYKWTARGKQTAGLGSKGNGRGQFTNLSDLTCDSDGNILALDRIDKDIQIFSFDTPSRILPAQTRAPEYQLSRTTTETADSKVISLLSNGMVLFDTITKTVILTQGDKKQEFKHPEIKNISAAHVNAARLYVFDRSKSEVFAFKLSDGSFDFVCGEGKLDDVTRILAAPGNALVMSDCGDTEIKVFSEDGIMSTKFGKKGTVLPEEIGYLRDITWHKGQLAVLDSGRNIIHFFSTNGSFVRNIEIKPPSSRVNLTAVQSDPNGFLMVLDSRNAKVLVVDDEGKVTFQFGSRGMREPDWKSPVDFMVYPDGTLRIVDAGKPSRLMSYHLRTAGVLSQAELAVGNSDWGEAMRVLQPFLSRDFSGTPDDIRATRLALMAYLKSDGKFPSKVQVDRAKTAIRGIIQNKKDSVEECLTLAACYKQDKQIEDAIAVLRTGQRNNPDPRYGELLADYARHLDQSGMVKYVVSIISCEAPPIMGAIYQTYHDNPEIKLTLSNDGGKATPACKALFYAKAIMDNPTETDIPPLKPFSTAEYKLKATLNRNVLTFVENTRLGAQVQILLGDGQPPIEKNLNVELLGRNSINWAKEQMIACFVTPKDQDVQMFTRQAVKTASDQTIQSDLDSNLFKALALFDAMQSLGMYYMPDPIQPFNFSKMSKDKTIDYVQFPRETLLRMSGDCDDLSVLYASLLEGAGIDTIMVTSPGHIFTAFKLEKGKQAI
ncbi:MAG: tetratricopeptide repeat protein, partial [Kiritimatiellae bacterium]|nr:tetratricopeptide repeat protein [Kiritimatiellia bacterium]